MRKKVRLLVTFRTPVILCVVQSFNTIKKLILGYQNPSSVRQVVTKSCLYLLETIPHNSASDWIKKYLDNNNNKGKWKIFFDITLKKYGCQNFFSYNLNVKDIVSTITTSDGFLKELLGIWAELNFEPEIASRNHFLDQQLWHNSLMKIANKTLFFSKLVQ